MPDRALEAIAAKLAEAIMDKYSVGHVMSGGFNTEIDFSSISRDELGAFILGMLVEAPEEVA